MTTWNDVFMIVAGIAYTLATANLLIHEFARIIPFM